MIAGTQAHFDMSKWKHIHEADVGPMGLYNCDELHQLGVNTGEFIVMQYCPS
jgi:hypothetical protein